MGETKYYHASNRILNVGKVYPFKGEVTEYHKGLTLEKKQFEDALDKLRPSRCPSRSQCLYFFDDFEVCREYASTLPLDKKVYIYEIVPEGDYFGGFPMCLVNKIRDFGAEAINKEYWLSTRKGKYKVMEYLTKSFRIVAQHSFIPTVSRDFSSADYNEIMRIFQPNIHDEFMKELMSDYG